MSIVSTTTEAIADMNRYAEPFDIEMVFRVHYGRVTRVIRRVVSDSARAEELAVEVFLKLWRNQKAQGENIEGCLYRTAVRMGLDELRSRTRRARYEALLGPFLMSSPPATPEEIRCTNERQEKVRLTLAHIERRQAEFLLLRSKPV